LNNGICPIKECKYPHLTQKELKDKIAALTISTVRIEPVGICYALCAEVSQPAYADQFSYCWEAVNPFGMEANQGSQATMTCSAEVENHECPIACLAAEENDDDPVATPIGRNGALCLLTETTLSE
jgi:hypothetical protein